LGAARSGAETTVRQVDSNSRQSLAASRLTIRLGALKRNYGKVCDLAADSVVGAAVKANGYGLGAVPVANALWNAGCRDFFVAYAAEGVEVRNALPQANIYVFNGAMPGTTDVLVAHDLMPLIVSLEQLEIWSAQARRLNQKLDVGLHFDSGMARTGIVHAEADYLFSNPQLLDRLQLRHVMSHMASADDLTSSQPEAQLETFKTQRNMFPDVPASLSNSAGVFRGSEFHFDLVRPGIALYGGSPIDGQPNPMEQTVVLESPIVQFKDVMRGDQVGYGATYEVAKPERHATLTVGYADGYLRSKSNSGHVWIGGHLCPVVGRVSMDLTIVNITEVPDELIYLGAPVEMIGDNRPIDEVAAAAGTIANELLTELGSRYDINYVND
jgi:alanine racemase